MLYKNQLYENLEELFDKKLTKEQKEIKGRCWTGRKEYRSRNFFRFKKDKVETWTLIKRVLKRYENQSFDKALKYLHLHSQKDTFYDITTEFFDLVINRQGNWNENYIVDGIILDEKSKQEQENYWEHRTIKTSVIYKGIEYSSDTLISRTKNEIGIKEIWIRFESKRYYRESANAYLHTRYILQIKALDKIEFSKERILLDDYNLYVKIYGKEKGELHFNTNILNQSYVDKLIIDRTEHLLHTYNERLNAELSFEFESNYKYQILKRIGRYRNKYHTPRLYTTFGETFEQIPVRELVVYNPPKKVQSHKKVNTDCVKIKSLYKQGDYDRIEPNIFSGGSKGWTDTRKRDFVRLQNKESGENQLTMERLGFDEDSFKTPTHIYRQIRNESRKTVTNINNDEIINNDETT